MDGETTVYDSLKGVMANLAHVTCTLDALPTVTGARFAFDNQSPPPCPATARPSTNPVTCRRVPVDPRTNGRGGSDMVPITN